MRHPCRYHFGSCFIKGAELEDALVSNLLLLFVAGFDTSSNMMTACLFFLARNPEVQERLFHEVNDADFNERMDYNTVMGLPYLDMVVYESMRHFPIVEITRICTKDYRVPGTDFTIPKGPFTCDVHATYLLTYQASIKLSRPFW